MEGKQHLLKVSYAYIYIYIDKSSDKQMFK